MLLHGPVKFVKSIFWSSYLWFSSSYMYFSPYAKSNQAKVWPRFLIYWSFCFWYWTELSMFTETTEIAKCGLDLDISFLCGGSQPVLKVFLLPMPMALFGLETVVCLYPTCQSTFSTIWGKLLGNCVRLMTIWIFKYNQVDHQSLFTVTL